MLCRRCDVVVRVRHWQLCQIAPGVEPLGKFLLIGSTYVAAAHELNFYYRFFKNLQPLCTAGTETWRRPGFWPAVSLPVESTTRFRLPAHQELRRHQPIRLPALPLRCRHIALRVPARAGRKHPHVHPAGSARVLIRIPTPSTANDPVQPIPGDFLAHSA